MRFNTIPEMFHKLCNKYPADRVAIMYKSGGVYCSMTFSELRYKVETFAMGLLEMGLRTGDRVGLVSENRIEWIIADLAVSIVGAVSVPIFPTLTSKQLTYIFNNCEANAIIVSNDFQLRKVLECKHELRSLHHLIVMNDSFSTDDLAVRSMAGVMKRGAEVRDEEDRRSIIDNRISKVAPEMLHTIIYTSGTTGEPKGVMLTHHNISSNVFAVQQAINFNDEDTFLSFLPLCHAYERSTSYYAGFSAGAVLALAESVESVKTNIVEVRPTIMTVVPKLLEMLKKKIVLSMEKEPGFKRKFFQWSVNTGIKYVHAKREGRIPFGLQSKYNIADKFVFSKIREVLGGRMRLFASGGAAMPVDVGEFFLAVGITTVEGYGLTEASPVVSLLREDSLEIGTIGRPMFNLETKISEDGELLVRGPSIMKGYWNDPLATADAIDEEGWLYTGDIVTITEHGNLKITDRKKNIIVNSGGKNIAPQPIETLIAQSIFVDSVYLVGEQRDFLTALIIPDFDRLKDLAANLGIKYSSVNELTLHPQVISTIQKDIDRFQSDLAKYERVRKFALLSQPFSVESGELTPKMSIRRHVVEHNYSTLIDQLYDMK